ncbi:phenylalanine--tRNA ligase subunit beta [Oceanobacillus neutriphilus]|uniref:Phenylalanine--tRNA ligase beta subunit n=1 Tax=Oceanobacillus neutriphilus TaxID=531815 RepID=A0ABQ2NY17_9BACI|nr:phenylalanine--tRNA ligase subunit beta [Oceanobacillus neutriphilus]GGP13388.1 phenylalanine--tRNA ligase beta subunit [Oceanobacillus neutriphilus]
MLVSYNWLRNYVNLDKVTPEELAEKITRSGIEVEGIEYLAPKSENIVVGYVKSCEKHPDADKLNLCQVDVGEESLQIICGAPNVGAGQKVAVAKPGAKLPNGMKIKKVKLRGVESNGMICSLQELGLDEKYIPADVAEGIFVFPEDAEVGVPVQELLNLDDAILDLDVLANRPDALSMLGVAYEVAAILDQPIELPDENLTIDESIEAKDYIDVKIDSIENNPYYGAFIIRDVEIKPAPLWMRNYLMASGIRPINNVVDITNFVLLEYGQPLHAFDYDQFGSKQVVIRQGKENETMVTLDDQERQLNENNLVITNGKEPVALAGVMGGADSEVTDETTNLLLEAAYFNSACVRHTVKQTGLRSESSTRFEKGVDPNRVKRAGIRACSLLQKYANGKVAGGVVEVDQLDKSEKSVTVTTAKINQRLGMELDEKDVTSVLSRLQFEFSKNGEEIIVQVPTRRLDISIFEDILEEVIRIYGYDHLPYTIPQGWVQAGGLTDIQLLQREIKNYLSSAGLMETLTYSLTNEKDATRFLTPDIEEKPAYSVGLAMPMSEEHSHLRLSLIPEMLRVLQHNVARTQTDLAYYEIGKVFVSREEEITNQPIENLHVAGALTGLWHNHPWQQEKKPVDFYVAKGIVEGLFAHLELDVTFVQTKMEDMHPGRCAEIRLNGKGIGYVGQVHPLTAKDFDVKETYVFEIDLESVFAVHQPAPSFTDIPRYPSVTRDIAFILDNDIPAGNVQAVIKEIGTPLVKEVSIFDVYQGEHMEEGKKSVAYRLLYQDPSRTLKDDEVDASYQEIIEKVNNQFGSYVRS